MRESSFRPYRGTKRFRKENLITVGEQATHPRAVQHGLIIMDINGRSVSGGPKRHNKSGPFCHAVPAIFRAAHFVSSAADARS